MAMMTPGFDQYHGERRERTHGGSALQAPSASSRQALSEVEEAGFTGQRKDSGSGLLYYGARWYDPVIGRFISADTIVPQPQNPQNLNRYSYVGNQPLRLVDPSGHAGVDFWGGGGGAGAGLGLVVALMQGAQQTMTQVQGAVYQYGPVAAEITWLYGNQTIAAGEQISQAVQNASQAGNTGSPDPNQWGHQQERVVREALARNYEQVYGTSDAEIRQGLNLQGKVADFVGYNSQYGRWLIAESKGGDMLKAVEQLQNTMKGVLDKTGVQAVDIDLRIYTNAGNLQRLLGSEMGLGGYRVRDGFLGFISDSGEWIWEMINGVRIAIQVHP